MFSRRPAVAVLAASVVPLAIRLALLPHQAMPIPRIHDEFSYLLAADTFAHGRLTNPPHPLWHFFETYHVLPQPTYMSKYPPAQGLFLAIGQILFGHPWWGVFLSIGIMCGSACWMLQAFVPGAWALLGSLAIGVEFGITNYWMNSYWGGAPGAIGGCLVVGALARILQSRYADRMKWYAMLLALGTVILLNSRPWEGLAILIPAGVALLYWAAKGSFATFRRRVTAVMVPAAALLAIGAAGMLYYNWRITGSPLIMPYRAAHQTYSVTPLFVWETRTPAPQYRHAVMQRFYLDVEPRYQDADTLNTFHGWLSIEKQRLYVINGILFGKIFALLALATVAVLVRNRRTRLLLIMLAAFVAALSVESWCQPHYFGPILAAAMAIKITSLRCLSGVRIWNRRIGFALVAVFVVASALALVQHAWADHPSTAPFQFQRAQIEQQLTATPGSHVILVRYSTSHNPIQEWVYNGADIDASKVIWAREMDPAENRRLFEYYRGRNFWLLSVDESPLRLAPYPVAPVALAETPAAAGRLAPHRSQPEGRTWN